MSSFAPPVSRRLTAARVLAVAALCMVPVSTALTNVFCALFAVAALSAPEFWRGLPKLLRQPAALAALLLLAALTASIAYSVAPPRAAWEWVMKYDKLLIVPFAIQVFRNATPNWRAITRWSLFSTLVLILLLSTTNYLGLTAIGPAHRIELPLSRAWVFKNHIAAGMFGALLFYQAADMMLAAGSTRARLVFGAIAALSLVDVFVMLQGRTGQLIALLLIAVIGLRTFGAARRRSPRLAALTVALFVAVAAALGATLATLHGGRLMQVSTEIKQYEQSDAVTSSGLRLDWYKRALHLYAARPLIGYGAGGLGVEFQKLSAGKTLADATLTENPHNEYLLMAVQLGTLGLVLFVNLLVRIGTGSRTLDARSRHLLLCWLAIFAIGSLANSLLLDFAEGHMLVLLAGILIGCGWRTDGTAQHTATARA
ncbi:O-antigen ligase family protein [Burkholderia glumae]|uniref:O-antigen ligase family protein n=3 Tax=Burkholderia glumae TaxID=337 RepID=A0AAP9Y276_BURGL|nr:O-antigen ligase family protein [Burkholderia glumae]ACR29727.1 O-antigen polymerase [Burkholderia glumae BGR1]AJY65384.1 O-Antigen ligase family protein [Burkholderia glumae LMG 2196 = ATCC 33617]MCM2482604.1 O-antigen ligase family protein [Burkholderia glumae]MCM2490755.1 O-antigen ligase family protein [Burkholderia glumae]MCM2507254.1 O-antigen ligase family protein [Burkholderia glumae]